MIFKQSYYREYVFTQKRADLNSYLNNWVERLSRQDVLREFEEDAYLGYQVLEDWRKNRKFGLTGKNENLEELLDYFTNNAGVFLMLVLGMPDSGKTATAAGILTLLKDKFRIVIVAPIKPDGYPEWVHWVSDPMKLRKGDLALIDEGSIKNNAKDQMTKKSRADTNPLAVYRHLGFKCIYLSQFGSTVDLSFIRFANIIVSKGYDTSVTSTDYERDFISNNPILKYLRPKENYALIPSNQKSWCVVTMKGKTMMVKIDMPDWYNSEASKTYTRFIDTMITPELKQHLDSIKDPIDREIAEQKAIKHIAMKVAEQMRKDQQFATTIKTELDIRGFRRPLSEWRAFTGEDKKPKSSDLGFD